MRAAPCSSCFSLRGETALRCHRSLPPTRHSAEEQGSAAIWLDMHARRVKLAIQHARSRRSRTICRSVHIQGRIRQNEGGWIPILASDGELFDLRRWVYRHRHGCSEERTTFGPWAASWDENKSASKLRSRTATRHNGHQSFRIMVVICFTGAEAAPNAQPEEAYSDSS